MRLDRFLKLSGLIKRRTLAQKYCLLQKIWVNGVIAKPSKRVSVGDVIEIEFPSKVVTIRVLEAEEKVVKRKRQSSYEVILISEKDAEREW